MHHTAFNLQRTPCLPLPRKRSPDGASTECDGEHLIASHYSFVDPQRMKGWVGLLTVAKSVWNVLCHIILRRLVHCLPFTRVDYDLTYVQLLLVLCEVTSVNVLSSIWQCFLIICSVDLCVNFSAFSCGEQLPIFTVCAAFRYLTDKS